MSVAERLAQNIDLLSMALQSLSELGRVVQDIDQRKPGAVEALTSTEYQLEELVFDRHQEFAQLSELFKQLYNRKYDQGLESLVQRIQSKES